MKYEKSCGAVVYHKEKDKIHLLLLKHIHGGHWSFPKGHVEQGENEHQTATREIKEETGLSIAFCNGFRHSVRYSPKQDVSKQVVYFLGETKSTSYKRQEEEISEIRWVDINNAEKMVTYKNDKQLINKVKMYLNLGDDNLELNCRSNA